MGAGRRERAKIGWAKKYCNEQLPWIDVVSEWKILYYHYLCTNLV
jgi:hypothetical protein